MKTIIQHARYVLTAMVLGASTWVAVPANAQERSISKFAVATPKALSSSELYQQTLRGTVHVEHSKGTGTGWIVDHERRLVITNDHVVAGQDSVDTIFPARDKDGAVISDPGHYGRKVDPVKAIVIDRDRGRDLALLLLDSMPSEARAIPLATKGCSPGEELVTVGGLSRGSLGLWGLVDGKVRGTNKFRGAGHNFKAVESTMAINPGNSGGPVVNTLGELVAVNSMGRPDLRSVTYHICVSEVKEFLKVALPLVDPKSAADYTKRGVRRVDAGRYDIARNDFAQALKLDRNHLPAMVGQARSYIAANDFITALDILNETITKDESNYEARVFRGRVLRLSGKNAEAIADYTKAIRLDPSLVAGYNERGITHMNLRNYQEALADFTQALKIDKTIAVIWGNRSDAFEALKEMNNCIEDLRSAIQLDSANPSFHNRLGLKYLAVNNPSEALKSFVAAHTIDDKEPVYIFNVGVALYDQRKFKDAVTVFGKALAIATIDPTRLSPSMIFLHRGRAHRELGLLSEAIDDFGSAIRQNGKYAAAYFERGLILKQLGKMTEAQADFDKAKQLDERYASRIPVMNPIAGTWKSTYNQNGASGTLTYQFTLDGKVSIAWTERGADGLTRELKDSGTYTIKGQVIAMQMQQISKFERRFERTGDKMEIENLFGKGMDRLSKVD